MFAQNVLVAKRERERQYDHHVKFPCFAKDISLSSVIVLRHRKTCDVKVCNNLATDEIDGHRIQSDYNMNCNIQKERTLHVVLRMRGEDSRHQ